MELKTLDYNDKKKWNDYVYNHKDSIAWHAYDWSEVVSKNYNIKFFPFATYKGNEITGILPLYKVNNKLISVAHAVAGGILANDKEAQKLLLDKAIETARAENIDKIIFKQYKIKIDAELSTDENFINKELNISRPIDKILNDFDDKNKFELNNITDEYYKLDFSPENIDIFYEILFNHNHRNGLPCVSKKWIKDLVDFKMYEIVLLRKGNQILAATMIKKYKKTVSFPFSSPLGKKQDNISNMYILYWLLIKHLSNEGIEIFHSGRIPKSNKADIYRLGWGGTAFNYYYQYYPKSIKKTEFAIKRGIKRELITKVWRMTPKFITRSIGPKIISKFP